MQVRLQCVLGQDTKTIIDIFDDWVPMEIRETAFFASSLLLWRLADISGGLWTVVVALSGQRWRFADAVALCGHKRPFADTIRNFSVSRTVRCDAVFFSVFFIYIFARFSRFQPKMFILCVL